MGFWKVILWIFGITFIVAILVAISIGIFFFITDKGIIDSRSLQEKACIERGGSWISYSSLTRSLTNDNYECQILAGGNCVGNTYRLGTNIGGNNWIIGRCSTRPSCVLYSSGGGVCSN